MKKKFQTLNDVKAADVQPIIDLLVEGKRTEANHALHLLCMSIKDLKHFEAFHLALKIQKEAGYASP